MALAGNTICPMCGTSTGPGTRRCLSCGEELRPASDVDIDRVRRQLRRWVVVRTATCAAFVYVLAFVGTQPSFGMGGPNYLSAALIAGMAAAVVGILLAARAYLHLQRILAENSGSTLWYQVGRKVRAMLVKQ